MKKNLHYSLMLLICLAAWGCKKDSQKGLYLLKQQITDDRADGVPLDTANYTYDDKNRITTITDGTLPNMITFSIEYDSQNRVTTARKFDGSGNLIIQFDFFYNPGSTGYIFHGSSLADTAYFTFNSNKQLTEITTKHSGSQLFLYDANGNVSSTQGLGVDGSSNLNNQASFAYDTKKNPFSETVPDNYFFMYVVKIGNPSTLINNVVEKNANTFVYTYNQAGFPVTATIKTYLSTIYVYYNYITK